MGLADLHVHSIHSYDGTVTVPAILKQLKRQGFAGNVSIEYEYDWDNNVSDAAQCIGFVRGYGSK